MSQLFTAVDELLAGAADLPKPDVRVRLRRASNLTQAQVAEALGVTPLAVLRWEKGQSEPRAERRKAYLRLLNGWAERHPEAALPEDGILIN
ncbi:helix-turn-helix domain-containing protein [Streptomyces sp. NPDC050485]|uniref:helix-turn-helix domain-containing protein n=1 Tax=Streptomyces sp. NPDC050485 TaxID=3365617 RepID=UPI0037BD888F